MSMIEWNNSYSVKVQELDDHHKKLVGFINELNDNMKLGKGKDVISKIVNEMFEYTKFHFSTEENYMNKFNYPNYEAHKKEHTYFINKVQEFKNELETSNSLVTVQVMGFLVDWLLKHISNTDKQYSKIFNDNGLK